MKDDLRQQVAARRARGPGAAASRLFAREYVQAEILAGLQRAGAMVALAFHGGTALRFLYSIRRFSEDLDFALERPERGYDFRRLVEAVRSDLAREGFEVAVKLSDRRIVHSAFVRFPGLPHELGLSGQRDETLSVKIEIDTQPPKGAGLEVTLVRRHVLLRLQHHDRASLLAGKLHALLQRPYVKGRDVYDLVWYLSDPGWPEPNLGMLNDALRQTGWPGGALTAGSWRRAVRGRFEEVDWDAIVRDVAPFLESPEERLLLTREAVWRLLRARR